MLKLQKQLARMVLTGNASHFVTKVIAARGTRERRLSVYRNNMVNSLTEVLRTAFPIMERIVGERFFRATAAAFINSHPPHQPTLFRYGNNMAVFLKEFAPVKNLPYLPDVARLEWARIESYFAADEHPMDPAKLVSIHPERLEKLIFRLHSSTRLIKSDFPVFDIWTINQPNESAISSIDFDRKEQGFVVRHGNNIVQKPMGKVEFDWLDAISSGQPLGAATTAATEIDSTFDLEYTLGNLLAEGTFSQFDY